MWLAAEMHEVPCGYLSSLGIARLRMVKVVVDKSSENLEVLRFSYKRVKYRNYLVK